MIERFPEISGEKRLESGPSVTAPSVEVPSIPRNQAAGEMERERELDRLRASIGVERHEGESSLEGASESTPSSPERSAEHHSAVPTPERGAEISGRGASETHRSSWQRIRSVLQDGAGAAIGAVAGAYVNFAWTTWILSKQIFFNGVNPSWWPIFTASIPNYSPITLVAQSLTNVWGGAIIGATTLAGVLIARWLRKRSGERA